MRNTASNGSMTAHDELARMWNETDVTMLSTPHFPVHIEESH